MTGAIMRCHPYALLNWTYGLILRTRAFTLNCFYGQRKYERLLEEQEKLIQSVHDEPEKLLIANSLTIAQIDGQISDLVSRTTGRGPVGAEALALRRLTARRNALRERNVILEGELNTMHMTTDKLKTDGAIGQLTEYHSWVLQSTQPIGQQIDCINERHTYILRKKAKQEHLTETLHGLQDDQIEECKEITESTETRHQEIEEELDNTSEEDRLIEERLGKLSEPTDPGARGETGRPLGDDVRV